MATKPFHGLCLKNKSVGESAFYFNQCLESDHFIDLEFVCSDGQRVSAHQIILAKYSPAMAELLEPLRFEGHVVTVFLPEFSKKVVMLVLAFMYRGSMDVESTKDYGLFMELLETLKIQVPEGMDNFKLEKKKRTKKVEKKTNKKSARKEDQFSPPNPPIIVKKEVVQSPAESDNLPIFEEISLISSDEEGKALNKNPCVVSKPANVRNTPNHGEADDSDTEVTISKFRTSTPKRVSVKGKKASKEGEKKDGKVLKKADKKNGKVLKKSDEKGGKVLKSEKINGKVLKNTEEKKDLPLTCFHCGRRPPHMIALLMHMTHHHYKERLKAIFEISGGVCQECPKDLQKKASTFMRFSVHLAVGHKFILTFMSDEQRERIESMLDDRDAEAIEHFRRRETMRPPGVDETELSCFHCNKKFPKNRARCLVEHLCVAYQANFQERFDLFNQQCRLCPPNMGPSMKDLRTFAKHVGITHRKLHNFAPSQFEEEIKSLYKQFRRGSAQETDGESAEEVEETRNTEESEVAENDEESESQMEDSPEATEAEPAAGTSYEEEPIKDGFLPKCFHCGIQYPVSKGRNRLLRHLVGAYKEYFHRDPKLKNGKGKCPDCTYQFKNFSHLMDHVALVHRQLPEYVPIQHRDKVLYLFSLLRTKGKPVQSKRPVPSKCAPLPEKNSGPSTPDNPQENMDLEHEDDSRPCFHCEVRFPVRDYNQHVLRHLCKTFEEKFRKSFTLNAKHCPTCPRPSKPFKWLCSFVDHVGVEHRQLHKYMPKRFKGKTIALYPKEMEMEMTEPADEVDLQVSAMANSSPGQSTPPGLNLPQDSPAGPNLPPGHITPPGSNSSPRQDSAPDLPPVAISSSGSSEMPNDPMLGGANLDSLPEDVGLGGGLFGGSLPDYLPDVSEEELVQMILDDSLHEERLDDLEVPFISGGMAAPPTTAPPTTAPPTTAPPTTAPLDVMKEQQEVLADDATTSKFNQPVIVEPIQLSESIEVTTSAREEIEENMIELVEIDDSDDPAEKMDCQDGNLSLELSDISDPEEH